jgi:hypothetical protein
MRLLPSPRFSLFIAADATAGTGTDGEVRASIGAAMNGPDGAARLYSRVAQFDITDEVIELLWIELMALEIVSWTPQLSRPSRVSQGRQ